MVKTRRTRRVISRADAGYATGSTSSGSLVRKNRYMPMNQFLFDHQLAAMKVDSSGSPEEHKEAVDLMAARAKRIADWRKENGLSEWERPHRRTS